jgi:hypothetical protein
MRLDDSGTLQIGTFSGNNIVQISAGTTGVSSLYLGDGSSGAASYAGFVEYNHTADYLRLGTGSAEAARIDSSGNLLVGTTTQAGKVTIDNGGNTTGLTINQTNASINYIPLVIHNDRVAGGSTAPMIVFQAADGSDVGSIDSNVSGTAYTTSSDARLKENIADAEDAGAKVDAIQVRQFDWKADGSHQDYGMVAQELLTVAPEAVSGDPESDDMMGVDYSKLVPMLAKEIQSLRARVAQLEGA